MAAPVKLDFRLWILDFGFYDVGMSTKSAKVAALVEQFRGRDLDPHYLGYFECFNRQLFYEAHEVLEQLWLGQRQGRNALFYKGLIQLAGAFVHLQKSRPQPAAALLRLAQSNLQEYPVVHERLDVEGTLRMIAEWLPKLELAGFNNEALTRANAPSLRLIGALGQ